MCALMLRRTVIHEAIVHDESDGLEFVLRDVTVTGKSMTWPSHPLIALSVGSLTLHSRSSK